MDVMDRVVITDDKRRCSSPGVTIGSPRVRTPGERRSVSSRFENTDTQSSSELPSARRSSSENWYAPERSPGCYERVTQRRIRSEAFLVTSASKQETHNRKDGIGSPKIRNLTLKSSTKTADNRCCQDAIRAQSRSVATRRRSTVPDIAYREKGRAASSRSNSLDVIKRHTDVIKMSKLSDISTKSSTNKSRKNPVSWSMGDPFSNPTSRCSR